MAPDLNQQIAHFEDRLRLDPNSRAFVPLADLYRRTGQLIHARDLLRNGVARHPGYLTAQVALGLVLSELGDGEEARTVMNGVLNVDPDNLLALRLLAAGASDRGHWERACELAERLVRLSPEDSGARDVLQNARRRLQTPAPAAPQAVRRVSGGNGDDAEEGMRGFETPTLAELYLRQGHPDKARVIIERILGEEPDRVDAQRVLAKIQAHDGAGKPAPEPKQKRANGTPVAAPVADGSQDLDRFKNWLDAASDQDRGARN